MYVNRRMKRWPVAMVFAITSTVALSGVARAQTPLAPADTAQLRQFIASQRGHVVVLDFWATWCEPCREELPHLLVLGERHKDRGLRVVTVSVDDSADVPTAVRLLDSLNAPAPRYIRRAKNDDAFINAIDPKWSGVLPAVFVYDTAGKRIKSFFGETDVRTIEKTVVPLLSAAKR